MASKQDKATWTTNMTNAMPCCRYRLLLKIVVLFLVAQLIYTVVYKRFELLTIPVLKGFGGIDKAPTSLDDIHKLPVVSTSGSHEFGNRSLQALKEAVQPGPNGTLLIRSINGNSSNHVNTTKSTIITGTDTTFQEILKNITRIFSMPRTPNRTVVDELKKELQTSVRTQNMFILSQTNVKEGEALHFAINRDRNQVISDQLYKSLPKESPFKNTHFRTCSVVGSGGILKASGCGENINKADYIFRCNSPPLKEFETDAGSKTNITTLNQSIMWKRFHSLQSSSDKTKFLKAMQAHHATILLPVFGTKSGYSVGRQITRVMNTAKNPPLKYFIIHPKHFTATQDFWKGRGIKDRMSTGFYLTSVAISLCEEIHLYGFWPFPKDMNQNNVPFHYYDSIPLSNEVHNFPLEFEKILQLHQEGVLNLHVSPCETDVDID